MSEFDKLQKEVKNGMEGRNEAIPIGLPRLGRYINWKKRIFTLLFSSTGAGKSSMADDMMLNAAEWCMKNSKITGKKIKFILFSMERSKHYRIAKWVSRKIFMDEGEVIPIPKLLGWWNEKLTTKEYDLFVRYKDYIDLLIDEYIDIYEGARSGADVYRILKEFFEKNGKYDVHPDNPYKRIYIPNDPDLIVSPIIDHGNLTRRTKDYPSKKHAVDNLCELMQGFRDLEGASPLWIAQVGRAISNPMRLKDTEAELTLDDVKESGDMGDACDVALSLFDPVKYKQSSRTGYNPMDFLDKTSGAKYFRSVMICKSSYGEDDLRIPLAFNGFCGQFKELPRKDSLNDTELFNLVESVKNKSYFLEERP
jgi:hypothetical protein